MGFVKKIWNDPVWSKVISGIILAILFAVAPALWNKIPFSNILQYLTDPISVSLWIVIISPLSLILLALLLHRRKVWPFATNFAAGAPVASVENAKPIFPTPEEQKQIVQMLKESYIPVGEEIKDPLDDPDEHRFYSIEKIRRMQGHEQKKHLNRFLCGLWEVTTRKGSEITTFEYQISTVSDNVLMRRRPGMKQVFNVQIRQIQFDADRLILKWVTYSESQKILIDHETLDVNNDAELTGMNGTGYIVRYTRKSLFKAI